MSDSGTNNEFLFDSEAFEAGQTLGERRMLPRAPYEVAATLTTRGVEGEEFVIYTRDINSGGSGFISPVDVGTIERGTVKIPTPDGGVRHVRCHVARSREIGEGWVEGYVEFDEPVTVFSSKRINAAYAQQRKPVFAGA